MTLYSLTVILAVLGLVSPWKKHLKHEQYPHPPWYGNLTPWGILLPILMLACTITICAITYRDANRNEAKAERLQTRLDGANATIDKLRNETIASFNKELALRQWRLFSTETIRAASLQVKSKLVLMESMQYQVYFACENRLPTAMAFDKWKESYDAYVFSLQETIKAYRVVLPLLDIKSAPEFFSLLDTIVQGVTASKAIVDGLPRELHNDMDPTIIKNITSDCRAYQRLIDEIVSIRLDDGYAERIGGIVPTTQPTSQPQYRILFEPDYKLLIMCILDNLANRKPTSQPTTPTATTAPTRE